jgi:hypothetical protein
VGILWWQDWPGWLITTVLAAVAAWVGVLQEIRYIRSRPNAVLWFERTGDMTRGTERWERFRVSNIGTGPVRLTTAVVVGAVPEYPDGDGHKLPRTIAMGDQHHIVVAPGDTAAAWVFLTALHPHRKGCLKVWWLPLDANGPLQDELLRQVEGRRSVRTSIARVLRREAAPVQPGGVNQAVVRASDGSQLMRLMAFSEAYPLI